MTQKKSSPLILEIFADCIKTYWKNSKLPFFVSLLFGFAAYTFAFTNKLVNHDEVECLFAKGATVTSGRWGLGFLDVIFPNISMPWIYGLLSIFFMAIAICIILRIFSVENKVLQVLLSGCVMVFPSLIGTFGYMFTSSSFTLAFLLAVVSVFLLKWNPKLGSIPALGILIFSVSIYQAYISVAAGLLVLILIQQLLQGEDVLPVIRRGVFYVVFLAAALGLYYAATQVFLKLLDVQMNSYASGNVSFRLMDIPGRILIAYKYFFAFFQEGLQGLMPTPLSRTIHMVCFICVLVLLVLWGIRQEKKGVLRYLLLAALVGILPLAANCMYLFTTEDAVHTLVLYGFVSFYIFASIVVDNCLRCAKVPQMILANAITLSLSLVIVINTYVANIAYLNLHLRYENAYAFYASLAAQIKLTPEFDENTKLAVLGTYREPGFYEEKLACLNEITGVKGFLPDSYSRVKFLEYYLDFPTPNASEEAIQAIQASDAYAAMPVYPYYGSMQMFDNVLVVKLS